MQLLRVLGLSVPTKHNTQYRDGLRLEQRKGAVLTSRYTAASLLAQQLAFRLLLLAHTAMWRWASNEFRESEQGR